MSRLQASVLRLVKPFAHRDYALLIMRAAAQPAAQS